MVGETSKALSKRVDTLARRARAGSNVSRSCEDHQ